MSHVLDEVTSILKDGAIFVHPTETVYGLGGIFTLENVKRVNTLKGREELKPIILLVLPDMVEGLARVVPKAKELMESLWPGPYTLLLPSRLKDLPWDYVGLRYSSDPFIDVLLKRLGLPILSTSANPSGASPLEDPEDILLAFGDAVDLYIFRGRISGAPSTILRVDGSSVEVVRQI